MIAYRTFRRGRLGNTPPFPQSRPTAARLRVGASPQAADQVGGNLLGGAGEERLRQRIPHTGIA